MSSLCRHCATPYEPGRGVDGFCCAGCRAVYTLIRAEGLDDFYRHQDRAAQPLKDRPLDGFEPERYVVLQSESESAVPDPALRLPVSGMSCLGCLWLVQRLAERQPGLRAVTVSLTENTLSLRWRPGAFDLGALAGELLRFGYRVEPRPLAPGGPARLSGAGLRLALCWLFTANAGLLAAFALYRPGLALLALLSLACLAFTLLLGAGPFFENSLSALRRGRWPGDGLPVLLILGAAVALAGTVIRGLWPFGGAAFGMCLVTSLTLSIHLLRKDRSGIAAAPTPGNLRE